MRKKYKKIIINIRVQNVLVYSALSKYDGRHQFFFLPRVNFSLDQAEDVHYLASRSRCCRSSTPWPAGSRQVSS